MYRGSSSGDAAGSMDRTNSTGPIATGVGGYFLGLITGIVVAGVLALLYAPKSGRETRELLKNEYDETQRMVQNWGNDVKQRMNNLGQIVRFNAGQETHVTGNGHQ